MTRTTHSATRRSRSHRSRFAVVFWSFWFAIGLVLKAQGALQFDVFLGYDGTVHEADWFPVACEVLNDGPPFVATFELSNESGGRTSHASSSCWSCRPTPASALRFPFCVGWPILEWTARLLDERGKVRAEERWGADWDRS